MTKEIGTMTRTRYPSLQARLSRAHDKLYAALDAFLRRVNPCKIKDGECLYTRRYADIMDGPKPKNTNQFIDRGTLCCTGCSLHKAGVGCTVQALGCKKWLCNTAIDSLKPKDRNEWYVLTRRASRSNLPLVRLGKCDEVRVAMVRIEALYAADSIKAINSSIRLEDRLSSKNYTPTR